MMDDGVKAEKENRTKNSHGTPTPTHTHTHTHTQYSGSFTVSHFKHGMVVILTFLYVLNVALSR